jgi:sialate O-acetylesterase
MRRTLAVPNTGMAITIDIGDPKDIHPQNKQDVGKRLAMWALASVYKQPGVVASGPLPAGHETRGAEMVLKFRYADGLVARGGDSLRGFEVAGEDHKWQPAEARIDGQQVIVSSPTVPKPVAARYAWRDNPDANLDNGAGLPASPFRTSEW